MHVVKAAVKDSKLHDEDKTRELAPPSGDVDPDFGSHDAHGCCILLSFNEDLCNAVNILWSAMTSRSNHERRCSTPTAVSGKVVLRDMPDLFAEPS